MTVPYGIKMFLPPLIILVLGGYAWGLGGKLSVTYNPVSSISLEDIPPPYCSMAAPNSSHNFMMYFFAVVDEIGGMVDEGELSWEGLMEELGRNLDPRVRQSLVQLGDHPKFTQIRWGTPCSKDNLILSLSLKFKMI